MKLFDVSLDNSKSTKNNLVIVCENYDEKLFKLFDKYNDLYNVEIMKPECLKSKENMINWNYGDLIEINKKGYINIMTDKNKTKFIDINENELFLEFKE